MNLTTSRNDYSILITDDDQDCREVLREIFEPQGYRTFLASCGEEALDIVGSEPVHLALLDMHMPGHTGLEVLETLRRETLTVPCIVISGEASEAVRKQALIEGACAVLRKPLEPRLLRDEVRRALRIDAA